MTALATAPTLFDQLLGNAAETSPSRGVAYCRPEPEAVGPTLDRIVVGAWEALGLDGEADCLVCGGVMRARPGAVDAGRAGACSHCGAELS